MTKIAIVPMAARPYHAGHDGLVRLAAKECDKVIVFASTGDRKRPGEFPISGIDMTNVWKTQIEPTLPGNVEVKHTNIPIRAVWETLGQANDSNSTDTFVIYSDPEDITTNFPEKSLLKYAGNLYKSKKIILRPVQRTETTNVSGTKMRQFLSSGDKKSFIKNLPQGVDGNAIWNILSKTRSESVELLKSFVNEALKRQ